MKQKTLRGFPSSQRCVYVCEKVFPGIFMLPYLNRISIYVHVVIEYWWEFQIYEFNVHT